MQYCPLCNKEYNDNTKSCPLRHCSNCGSLNIKRHWGRKLTEYDADDTTVGLIGLGIILAMVGGLAYISNMPIAAYTLFTVLGVLIYMIYLRNTSRQYKCADCGKQKFLAQVDIGLEKSRSRKQTYVASTMQVDANVARETFKIVKELKKPIKQNWILQVAVTIVGIIISISNHEVILNHFTSLFAV